MPLITHLHNVFTFVKLSPTKISLICCCKLFHISFIFKLNRGTSTITKHAPFREEYGRLHEIRSLIGTDVSFVALTRARNNVPNVPDHADRQSRLFVDQIKILPIRSICPQFHEKILNMPLNTHLNRKFNFKFKFKFMTFVDFI